MVFLFVKFCLLFWPWEKHIEGVIKKGPKDRGTEACKWYKLLKQFLYCSDYVPEENEWGPEEWGPTERIRTSGSHFCRCPHSFRFLILEQKALKSQSTISLNVSKTVIQIEICKLPCYLYNKKTCHICNLNNATFKNMTFRLFWLPLELSGS